LSLFFVSIVIFKDFNFDVIFFKVARTFSSLLFYRNFVNFRPFFGRTNFIFKNKYFLLYFTIYQLYFLDLARWRIFVMVVMYTYDFIYFCIMRRYAVLDKFIFLPSALT